ncbi:hypothetical protein QJS10_CPA09g01723 [Acorus calamus]|uniref:Uncharacterized protein n=1 Tax=Acorus calamus TaxID=4465 RepID=A0AAV9E3X9_ACOCL|nr:hypothetical protein QJS10_CPA09g01723 [Acorus calamus]
MRRMNDSVETVNAAATAIITAESRVRQDTEQVYNWRRRSVDGCSSLECFKELMIIAS